MCVLTTFLVWQKCWTNFQWHSMVLRSVLCTVILWVVFKRVSSPSLIERVLAIIKANVLVVCGCGPLCLHKTNRNRHQGESSGQHQDLVHRKKPRTVKWSNVGKELIRTCSQAVESWGTLSIVHMFYWIFRNKPQSPVGKCCVFSSTDFWLNVSSCLPRSCHDYWY